jgi:ATP-dependent RNA helicase RhlE
LIHILNDKNIKSALIFSRTKHGADKITKDLVKAGIKTEAIHGNKSQNARQKALSNFKSGQIKALIATDIAARGIDIDELSHVINYELPNVPETYVHRIGRTGRAGSSGIAYSFCDEEEMEYLKDIQKLIGKEIPVIDDQPYHMRGAAYIMSQSTKKKGGSAKKGKASSGAAPMSGSPNRRFSNKRR